MWEKDIHPAGSVETRVDNDRGRTLCFLLFLDMLFFHSVAEHAKHGESCLARKIACMEGALDAERPRMKLAKVRSCNCIAMEGQHSLAMYLHWVGWVGG